MSHFPTPGAVAAVPAAPHCRLQDSLHADVWHAHTLATPVAQVVATGAAVLDAQLPGGGWPVGALTELLQATHHHGEWRLLAPALARCGTKAVVLVGPPRAPFGPALAARGVASHRLLWVDTGHAAQRLWATEQALRCAGVDAVLAWLPQARADQLRRLQMAASEFHRLLFVVRPGTARQESSPAVLRLEIRPAQHIAVEGGQAEDVLQVHILKRRGPPLEQALQVPACEPALARLLAAAQSSAPVSDPLAEPLASALPESLPVPPMQEIFHALDRAAA